MQATDERNGSRNYLWQALSNAIGSLVVSWEFSRDPSVGVPIRTDLDFHSLEERNLIDEVGRQMIDSLIMVETSSTFAVRREEVIAESKALMPVFRDEFKKYLDRHLGWLEETRLQVSKIQRELGL